MRSANWTNLKIILIVFLKVFDNEKKTFSNILLYCRDRLDHRGLRRPAVSRASHAMVWSHLQVIALSQIEICDQIPNIFSFEETVKY